MAGLLDFLMTPESQLGIGLLAAAGSGRSFGEGLLGATQSVAAQRRGLLQDKLLQSQVDENTSQAEMRKQQLAMAKRQMEIDNSLLGYGARPDAGYVAPSAGGGGVSPALMGAPSSGGAAAPTVSTPGGPMSLSQLSSAYGVPYEALAFDLVKNGGKGISDMIYKRGTPDIQVSNGYAYDKNRLGAGFLPSLSTAQDGKTSMVRIGADGLPVVSAPQGSVETYGAYQRAAADNKPIKVYNPTTGREEYTSEGNVVRGARSGPDVPSPGYAGGSRDAAAPEQIRMMQNELMKLPQNHPDVPALQREIKRLQGSSSTGAQSGNYAAGPSAAETAAAAAAQASAVDTAKADVVRDTGNRADNKRGLQLTSGIDRAIELLGKKPTSSLLGSLADRAMGAAGMSTDSADVSSQLQTLSGWLVSNVPRMEGPQSNVDVANYQVMAGAVGDPTRPISQRLRAAEEVKRLQDKYAELNGIQRKGSGATGSWDEPAANRGGQSPRVVNFSDLK